MDPATAALIVQLRVGDLARVDVGAGDWRCARVSYIDERPGGVEWYWLVIEKDPPRPVVRSTRGVEARLQRTLQRDKVALPRSPLASHSRCCGRYKLGISREFRAERKRMATLVWSEYKDNDSRACRGCHVVSPEMLAKQPEAARDVHKPVLQGHATCIDCHKGVGHVAP
jgi:hypothetical protein